MKRSTMAIAVALLGVTSFLWPAPLPPEVPIGESLQQISAKRMIADLQDRDGTVRTTAARELLRRGDGVLDALRAAGARDLYSNLFAPRPTRLDLVYSLLLGQQVKNVGFHNPGKFILFVEENVTEEDVRRMGKKHDFVPGKLYRPNDGPAKTRACDCTVNAGAELSAMEYVFRSVLVSEPRVLTMGLSYRW